MLIFNELELMNSKCCLVNCCLFINEVEASTSKDVKMTKGKVREFPIQPSGVLFESDVVHNFDDEVLKPKEKFLESRNYEIVWRNVVIMITLHAFAVFGAYLFLTGQVMWKTFVSSE